MVSSGDDLVGVVVINGQQCHNWSWLLRMGSDGEGCWRKYIDK